MIGAGPRIGTKAMLTLITSLQIIACVGRVLGASTVLKAMEEVTLRRKQERYLGGQRRERTKTQEVHPRDLRRRRDIITVSLLSLKKSDGRLRVMIGRSITLPALRPLLQLKPRDMVIRDLEEARVVVKARKELLLSPISTIVERIRTMMELTLSWLSLTLGTAKKKRKPENVPDIVQDLQQGIKLGLGQVA